MRDASEGVSPKVLIGAATLAADNTPPAVALAGFDSATILLAVGVGGITFSDTNKVEFKLTHSEDGVTYDAVAVGDVKGAVVAEGGIIKSLVAAHAAAAVYEFAYLGTRKHLKLLADFSGTHGTGTPIAATALLGAPVRGPVA